MIFLFAVKSVISAAFYVTHPNHLFKFSRWKKGSTGTIYSKDLPKSDLNSCKNNKAEKLNRNREAILKARISCIITVSNRGNYGTNPIVSEDNQVNVALAYKIFMCQGPWKITLFKINESLTPNINE